MASRWPRDDWKSRAAFYGDPEKGQPASQLVDVFPPFRMTYEGKPVRAIKFHRKAAPALRAALDEIWEYYGRDQKKIDATGVSKYAGAFNSRKIRGRENDPHAWSNHAYGAAIDLDADGEALGTRGHMPSAVVAAFERQGAKWGGNYVGRKDPMHFEFVDNGKSAASVLPFKPERNAPLEADPPDVGEPEPDDTKPHAAPAGSPKTGITEGAQVGVGLGAAGVLTQIWTAMTSAPETILQALVGAAQKPEFLIFALIVGAAAYVWWRRHNMKKAAT